MRKMIAIIAAGCLTVGLAPLVAGADNEENCLSDQYIVLFSGTDAGAARRGLNIGTVGCNTAGDADLPFVDTNVVTPGATHGIVGVTGRPQATPVPAGATLTLGDMVVELEWVYENSRWESQSIAYPADTGTVTIVVPGIGTTTYEKIV